ncbi:hypothetical protein GKZ90_0004980 [Flavobacterium sp. MC2016-06]|jgi:hypothetical protein|uniref:hypothetical protein n=1 Tax=Flavobacterium sp. MC2016-06 TaxID=2676308 RepID=UPI0012BB141D|nr:hypothetical protein [Flavobacterium sp. MC2016-06]MBU3862488.1 hypothetical protein [Flavobacterium sp. MC2016-06]
MKFVGFIKEYNNITEAQEYKKFLNNAQNNKEIVSKITAYLNNGTVVLAWMNTLKSLDNDELIAPNCYCTDGSFVWPAYFAYYLKKYPNYKIDDDFLEHLEKNNFDSKKIKVSDKLKSELQKKLIEKNL